MQFDSMTSQSKKLKFQVFNKVIFFQKRPEKGILTPKKVMTAARHDSYI